MTFAAAGLSLSGVVRVSDKSCKSSRQLTAASHRRIIVAVWIDLVVNQAKYHYDKGLIGFTVKQS